MTEDALGWLWRHQRWLRVQPGVYRINGAPDTWQSRVRAACLAAGLGSLASGRSAAALWELEGFEPPRRVDLTVKAGQRPRIAGAKVRRSRDLHLARPTTRQGVPVTGIARTLLDLCAVERNPDVALRALDDARRRRLVSMAELWECLVAHSRRGRAGVKMFRDLLQLRDGKEPSHSVFEARLRQMLVEAGLPEPEAQVRVGPYRMDLGYPEVRVGIECDGQAAHLNERAFEEDPVRENSLKLAGWLVLRYTWQRLRTSPEGVVEEVASALLSRQRAG